MNSNKNISTDGGAEARKGHAYADPLGTSMQCPLVDAAAHKPTSALTANLGDDVQEPPFSATPENDRACCAQQALSQQSVGLNAVWLQIHGERSTVLIALVE